MKIFNLRTENLEENGRDMVYVKADIKTEIESPKYIFPKTIWFSTTKEFSNFLTTDRFDAFLVALLVPALRNGEDRIFVDGKLSAKLYDNIGRLTSLMRFYLSRFPNFKPKNFEVIAREYDSSPINYHNIMSATGFSGGVDSLYAIYEYYHKVKVDAFKIKILTLFNTGATLIDHADFDIIDKEFWDRYESLKISAERLNINCLPLDSNIVKFNIWPHAETHSITSASAALMLQNRITRYYYASSGYSIEEVFTNCREYLLKKRDTSTIDMILLPLLSTDTMEIISQGAELTRMEKVQYISDYTFAQDVMNVCIHPIAGHKNCGICPKCQRTLLALDLLGKLDKFSKVFDIEKYRNSKKTKRYIARQIISANSDLFAKQFVTYAREHNISLYNKTSIIALVIEFFIYSLKKIKPLYDLYLVHYRKTHHIAN